MSARQVLRDYLRSPWLDYVAPGPLARRTLIVLAIGTLLLDSLVRATGDAKVTVASAVVTTSISIAIALFAWRPPAGTLLFIAVALAATFAGVTDTLLAGALPVGLIVVSCSARLTGVYLVAWALWLTATMMRPGSGLGAFGGVVALFIAATSLIIGVFFRQQHERAQSLATQLEATEREVADQLRHERDLIADELHDIVAHEITIVALHAAVLERTDDAHTRTQSQTAIREAAVQALTDIRRVLGMVRGEENLAPERIPSADSLPETIATVTEELGRAGIRVTADVPDDLRLPSASHVALVRVIRESSTNVLKHATGARTVRITLAVERGWARLEFADDSPPARTAGLPASGYGIMRLQERFRLFGGSFSAERRPSGWVVSASLPLEA